MISAQAVLASAQVLFASLLSQNAEAPAADTIRVSGPTNAAFVEDLKRQVTPATRTVVVESSGGEEAAAIEAGEFILSRGLSVRVDRYCLSACALYVLAGAKDVELSAQALVGFHTPALGAAQLLQSAVPGSEPYKRIDAVARRSVDLYVRAKKSPKILLDAFYAADVDCLLLVKREGVLETARTRGRVDVWVPARSSLEDKGWVLKGSWPSDEAEASARAKIYLKDAATVAYGANAAIPRKLDITVSDRACPTVQKQASN